MGRRQQRWVAFIPPWLLSDTFRNRENDRKEGCEARLWELVRGGVESQRVEFGADLDEAQALLSPGHPDIGGHVLLKVRDKIGFHWDPQPFSQFLDDTDVTEAIFWESAGRRNYNQIFLGRRPMR